MKQARFSLILLIMPGIGLVTGCVPEWIGGAGWDRSILTGTLMAEELAWGDLAMAMHILAPSLAIVPLVEMGTEEQKEKYLPRYATVNSQQLPQPSSSRDTTSTQITSTRPPNVMKDIYYRVVNATCRWPKTLPSCLFMLQKTNRMGVSL